MRNRKVNKVKLFIVIKPLNEQRTKLSVRCWKHKNIYLFVCISIWLSTKINKFIFYCEIKYAQTIRTIHSLSSVYYTQFWIFFFYMTTLATFDCVKIGGIIIFKFTLHYYIIDWWLRLKKIMNLVVIE